MVRKSSLILILFLPSLALAAEDWWNNTWQYRVPINVSSESYARQDMPVELIINFTDLLDNLNDSDTFDDNSIRIIESGFEIPSQFDEISTGYGELIWIANGTTSSLTNRSYFIYFDTDNNAKTDKV